MNETQPFLWVARKSRQLARIIQAKLGSEHSQAV
jgi:hypothetical protein